MNGDASSGGRAETPNDEELHERWCAGDRAAGNALFSRYFSPLLTFFERKTDSGCDDLVQETFTACTQRRDQFRRQSSFRTYLYAIAKRRLYDHWSRLAAQAGQIDYSEISIASLSTSAGGRLSRHEDEERLLAALRQLSLEQQLMLELYYWEEMDGAQLAEIFEIEPATTRSRLHRARTKLLELLTGELQLSQDGGTAEDEPPSFAAWMRARRPRS